MDMVGYNIYFIPRDTHPETGDGWEGDPLFLHLSYGSWQEAEAAKKILEQVYGVGQIEIDVKAYANSYQPGEGC